MDILCNSKQKAKTLVGPLKYPDGSMSNSLHQTVNIFNDYFESTFVTKDTSSTYS